MSSGGAALRRQPVGDDQADAARSRDRLDGAGPDRRVCKGKLVDHEDYLRELTRTRVGITLEEMKAALREERGVAVSITAVWRSLRKLGLSHKKSH